MDVTEQAFLRRCGVIYETLVEWVLRLEARGNDEETVKWLSLAAGAAWVAHPGRFADQRLEAVALRAGQRLQPLPPLRSTQGSDAAAAEDGRRRVLHVATTVGETGGHARLIENWIRYDDASCHSLVLLDQRQTGVRAELAGGITASGGELIAFPPGGPLLDKARRLRQVAQAGYDLIVLHHHPDDVVPLVALATEDCPPVAVMNHADHVFWLGVSVADAVIDFREFGARLGRERRGVRQSLMFPLPLDLTSPAPDRTEARERLGIPEAEVMLLSIAAWHKYMPTKTHNFFRAANRVLADNPTARFYVVGVGERAFRALGVPRHERVELLGVLSDPSVYQAAADLYLESFPIGSHMALFDTAARGVCPVLRYAPTSHTDRSNEVPLKGVITNAADEADYVARVTDLIRDPAERTRIGQIVAQRVASFHGADAARACLQRLYAQLAGMTHRPAAVEAPASAEEEHDLHLARFNNSRIKRAVLQQVVSHARVGLTIGELFRILVMSLRAGDTRLTPSHAAGWLAILWRRVLPRRAV